MGPTPQRCSRGLTLIEITIALAVLAILATMAMPTLGERLARQRLASLAETLAMDLNEARLEAVQSGQPLHVVFSGDAGWCYAVASTAGCACGTPQPCQLKTERAADWPGVTLVSASNVMLEPVGTPDLGVQVSLRGVDGQHEVQVSLSLLGRARICTTTQLAGQAPC